MGKNAFDSSKALTNVTIQDGGLTRLDAYAFQKCSQLSNITIPNSVLTIGSSAFADCTALAEIILPNGLRSFEGSTFSNSGLVSVVIPPQVTQIYNGCFKNCKKLTRVVALGGITKIYSDAFNGCTALEEVDFTACTSVPTLSNINAFSGVPDTCQIKVPSQLYESWKSATNWSTYASRIVAVPVIKIDDDVYKIEEGMTWGEWIVSEYAPEGKFIVLYDNIRVAENNNYVVRLSDGSTATPDMVMNSGDSYYQSEP
jgi:hypothetical protein